PEVHRDRIPPALAKDGDEAPLDLGEGLVPARGLEPAVAPDERGPQAVRVGVELLQRIRLGADEAPAEDVRLVAPDAHDLPAAAADLEPAGRFAQRADAIAGAFVRHPMASVSPGALKRARGGPSCARL